MTTRNFRPEHERTAIAQAFATSGLTQKEYATQQGISDRALRQWLRRYTPLPGADAEAEARRVIEKAIHQLQALLRSLDAGRNCRVEEAPPKRNLAPPAPRGTPVFLTQ